MNRKRDVWRKKLRRYEPHLRRIAIFLLLLLFLSEQYTLWKYLGIRTGADTQVYIDAANDLLDGELPHGRLVWYSAYITFLAGVFAIGGSFQWVVLLQILLSGVAGVALWFAVEKMKKNFWVSCVAVLLYLSWFKIHQWNSFIYTESLFTSMAIITFAVLLHIKRAHHYLIFSALFLLTFFLRPTGFSLLIGLMLYSMCRVELSHTLKLTLGLSLLLGGLILLNSMLEQFTLIESYAKGEIIYPNISLGVEVPNDLFLPDVGQPPLMSLLMFVLYNPYYFTKISLLKLFLFLANVKPYFSVLHNVLIALVLYPLYIFAFLGFRYFPTNTQGRYFIVGFALSQSLTVMLTTENWDGRFLIPVLPFIFILSAIGTHRVIKHLRI